jgi:hypothetical protein
VPVAVTVALSPRYSRKVGVDEVSMTTTDPSNARLKPALDDVRAEVDVLDPGVGEVDLAPEENAPAHRDALGVKAVAQRVVAEVEGKKGDEEEGAEDERERR